MRLLKQGTHTERQSQTYRTTGQPNQESIPSALKKVLLMGIPVAASKNGTRTNIIIVMGPAAPIGLVAATM
jgi:hypothetical protein